MGVDPSTTGHDSSSLAATPTAATAGGRGGKSSAKKRHGLPLSGKKHKNHKGKNDECDESNRTLSSSRNSIFDSNQADNKTTASNGVVVPAFKRNNLFN
jgi:hypothetical protein